MSRAAISPHQLLDRPQGEAIAAGWGFLAVILATNFAPAIGVLFFGWGVFILLLLYWLENLIIGLFVALRLDSEGEVVAKGGQPIGKLFFFAHYGVFMAVHGLFVVALFLEPKSLDGLVAAMGGWWWMIVAVASLFFEHAYAYHMTRVTTEASRGAGVATAYVRLMIMHVTIIGGGMAAQTLGSPNWALLTLIALKTLFDVITWMMRLPSTGALGRVKKAFRAGLEVGMMAFVIALLLIMPLTVVGAVVSGIVSPIGGRRVQPETWILGYGLAAAGIVVFVVAASAWLHELLSGLDCYRQSPALAKAGIVLAVVSSMLAAAWLAVHRFSG